MTVTSGFFDSLSSDRLYSAAQMGSIFNGIITNGIYSEYLNAFGPVANDTMFVTIGSGRAWFDETWTYNDADVDIEIATAEPALDRIDTIVLEVNRSVSIRANTLKVIEGTPAGSPVPPTLVDTAEIVQYPLVDVYVAAAVTEIYTGDLTDRRGSVDTPWVSHLWMPDAADDLKGIVELATTAEVDTGTDAERVITPLALKSSDLGVRAVSLSVFGSDAVVAVGDGIIGILIPAEFDGWDIVDVIAAVTDKGVTGATEIQVRRRRAGSDVDVLSTRVTIGDEWFAADGVINNSNDDVATGDVLFIDPDVIHSGTAPNGLYVTIVIRLP